MHLNDHETFPSIDTQNMLSEIDGLPDQLVSAWEMGQQFPLPPWKGITRVVIAGMGGSAIGGSLIKAYAAPLGDVPITVHRDYGLPSWVKGKETLLIVSSHSGNTEETLSAFEAGLGNGCRMIGITTGGRLAEKAVEGGEDVTLWRFDHPGQPRAAVGYSFALLLAALFRLGLIPDPTPEVEDAAAALREQQKELLSEVPIAKNPAKRLAGQLVDRWVCVLGAGLMEPVARRWKGQLNELAKTWAQFEALPEADHNTLASIFNPENLLLKTAALFLRGDAAHARNQLRGELTKKYFMLEGLNTDFVDASGKTRLAQQWTVLHLGDYVAYYLAMLYEEDPTPVAAIEHLKEELKSGSFGT
ncbi:MAG: bifunctional phosphoglucose/phosphomannose isomerase [Anaerolineales bacterium]